MNERVHLFGPVPSRRLGRSLGVDLVPFKTCTLDCIYCQLGSSGCTMLERAEYVDTDEVLEELDAWQSAGGRADAVTLSGSGEPTLHTRFGDVLAHVHCALGCRSVLLSNGTLMTHPAVRADAALADVVKVTLSAWDQASFIKLHRPHAALVFDAILEGYRELRRLFRGELWVEVFVVPGINDSEDAMKRIAGLLQAVSPDAIHLNTAVRPAAEPSVTALDANRLHSLALALGPKAEVIASFAAGPEPGDNDRGDVDGATFLRALERHPATAQQTAAALGAPIDRVAARLAQLADEGLLAARERNGEVYYGTP